MEEEGHACQRAMEEEGRERGAWVREGAMEEEGACKSGGYGGGRACEKGDGACERAMEEDEACERGGGACERAMEEDEACERGAMVDDGKKIPRATTHTGEETKAYREK